MAMIHEDGSINRHHLVFSRSLDKKIDNKSTTAHACDTSGKHTERRMVQADGTHSFGNSGSFTVDDGLRCLWCDITWSQSCTACCENEIEMFVITPFAQCCLNQFAFIRDNCACTNDCFW